MFARPLIDSIDFARNANELSGEIAITALDRLSDILASSEGMLAYTLSGSCDDDRLMLKVVLNGVCHLRCQRCLGEFSYIIDMTSHLHLLPSNRLDEMESDDAADGIEATSSLDVLALVEDELLLSLPFAPMHPEEVCSAPIKSLEQAANPFLVLAGLKKQ